MSANLGSLATRKISWRSACVNAYRIWASIGTNTAASSVAAPTLQSAHINSCDFTCSSQPGTLTVCLINVPDQFLAVIQGNHSSPSSRIIASSFFDSTSSAAVSAKAFSLRGNSRSSACMRLRSCLRVLALLSDA